MTVILETERLVLRYWEFSDAKRLFEICCQPRVMKHIGKGEPYKDLQDAENSIMQQKAAQAKRGFSRWAVVEKVSRQIIGSCGFGYLEKSDEIELGYLFDEKYWGKGFATEAARKCSEYGFINLGFREIIALTDLDHLNSHKILEKIGFTKRGIEIYYNEETLVYSTTKHI